MLFICTLGLQERSQDFPLGGGVSDFIGEMFTTGRQTWTVSVNSIIISLAMFC